MVGKFIRLLNATVFRGYKNYVWDEHTKVSGEVISTPEEYEKWAK